MRHLFPSTAQWEYNIHGIAVGSTLTEENAPAIGRGLARIVRSAGGKTLAIGYDEHMSSPLLEAALIRGLMATEAGVWERWRNPPSNQSLTV